MDKTLYVSLQQDMTHITKEELEAPRKASEIRQWVDDKIEEIGTTKEGKRAVRFREGLTKELTEEALPLGIFCERYFDNGDQVTVQHIIGNQTYDAIIDDQRETKTTLKYLEITQAHEGEDAHLRMLKLEEEGHVNSLGKVTKQGTKHTGITIEVENEAVEHGVTFSNELQRIHDAAQRKSEKEYPDNTGLIIICDDYIAFRDDADAEKLKEHINNEILPMLTNFSIVFIVGWSSKTFLEFV
ncbi:hypothetical protein KA005_38020, partial [bacterium]|nr:hypothetical protein [bacterium]